MARFSSGGVAIYYVLPVLWMTSRSGVMGRMPKHGGCTIVKRLPRCGVAIAGRSLMSTNVCLKVEVGSVDVYVLLVAVDVSWFGQ